MPGLARSRRRALLIALALTLTPALADADDSAKRRAQALLLKGNVLLEAGSHSEALATFQIAYETYPSPALLLNIGTALRALERHSEASNHYAQWLQATRRPTHRAEVEEVLAELDRMVGRVVVDVSERGARIKVDGAVVNPVLLGNVIRLDPGRHRIIATKKGFKAARASFELAAGEIQRIRLELVRPKPKAKPEVVQTGPAEQSDDDEADEFELGDPETDSAPAHPGRTLRIGGITLSAFGLVGLAVGLKFGLDARGLSADAERFAAAGQTPELNGAVIAGQRAENRFIAFTAAGGAALIAGGVLYAVGHFRGKRSTRRVSLAPVLSPEAMTVAIAARF